VRRAHFPSYILFVWGIQQKRETYSTTHLATTHRESVRLLLLLLLPSLLAVRPGVWQSMQ
jgi:hypothetical protein